MWHSQNGHLGPIHTPSRAEDDAVERSPMYPALVGLAASHPASPAAAAVVGALEHQAARLEALVRRVAAARTSLPSADSGVWTGPAHLVYAVALQSLVADVDAAHRSLESALGDSRRAHAAVAAGAIDV